MAVHSVYCLPFDLMHTQTKPLTFDSDDNTCLVLSSIDTEFNPRLFFWVHSEATLKKEENSILSFDTFFWSGYACQAFRLASCVEKISFVVHGRQQRA